MTSFHICARIALKNLVIRRFDMNCWEFTQCGRGKEGGCPAWPDNGDICAEVVGTFCVDKDCLLGINAIKLKDCSKCEFFHSVHYKGYRKHGGTKDP